MEDKAICTNCSRQLEKKSLHPDFEDLCDDCFREFIMLFHDKLNFEAEEFECLTCDCKIKPQAGEHVCCCLCDRCSMLIQEKLDEHIETMLNFYNQYLGNLQGGGHV